MKNEDLIVKLIESFRESNDQRLDNIDKNLSEHMRRTKLLEDRVEVLEEPSKVLIFIKKIAIWISAVVGGILVVIKLIQYI